jgi:hypothetical protein
MFTTELALVADTEEIDCSQLSRVCAALQKQAIRDLRPIWQITATVDAFDKLEDIPLGYWPIIVRDDIDMPGAAGVHLDQDGQPFSLVQYSDSWSLTASHELLEMLVDPWGSRLIAGDSPKADQGRVEFLVEVADPSEDAQFGYTVNGFLVSDFYTPQFFDPVTVTGVRYSFGGHLPGPRQVVEGGYLSWHDPVTDEWWQQTWFDAQGSTFHNLGKLTGRSGSLRSAIDARTGTSARITRHGPTSERLTRAVAFMPSVKGSANARAEGWRGRIEGLRAGQLAEAQWEGGDAD